MRRAKMWHFLAFVVCLTVIELSAATAQPFELMSREPESLGRINWHYGPGKRQAITFASNRSKSPLAIIIRCRRDAVECYSTVDMEQALRSNGFAVASIGDKEGVDDLPQALRYLFQRKGSYDPGQIVILFDGAPAAEAIKIVGELDDVEKAAIRRIVLLNPSMPNDDLSSNGINMPVTLAYFSGSTILLSQLEACEAQLKASGVQVDRFQMGLGTSYLRRDEKLARFLKLAMAG